MMGAMAATESTPGTVDADGIPEYSIDELAAVTGVPSRTIRFYQSKGTLPAPERRGRVAVYREEHAERLRTISELQERGLRLDAIREVLELVSEGGDSLQSWLGVGDRLQSAWTDDRPAVVSRDDLVARVGEHRPGMLAELERAGIIRRQGNSRPPSYLVRSPRLLDITLRLDRAGVDLDTAVGAERILRNRISKASDELVAFFGERLGKGFGTAVDAASVAESFDAVRPLGVEAVQLVFAQEMERALRAFVESGGVVAGARKVRDQRRELEPDEAERRKDRKAREKALEKGKGKGKGDVEGEDEARGGEGADGDGTDRDGTD
jgi:DNA-binding transcriptional MerR regulator